MLPVMVFLDGYSVSIETSTRCPGTLTAQSSKNLSNFEPGVSVKREIADILRASTYSEEPHLFQIFPMKWNS